MHVIKFNPFGTLRRSGLDTLFNEFLNAPNLEPRQNSRSTLPSVNVINHEDRFEIQVAAPGLDKNDFRIEVENDQLVISASRERQSEAGTENQFTRREFNYSAFRRAFYLSEDIDQENILANYNNGLLTVTLGKKEEVVKDNSRVIEIS